MITFIVYEESEKYPLGSLMFLYRQSGAGSEVFFVEKPEEPADLPELLDNQPLKKLSDEWRILFLDCSQAYACENPYEAYEDHFQYIGEFLSLCAGNGGGRRRITRFSPQGIYCAVMRSGLYFHTEREGYLYSDFAAGRGSDYRYLIFDVGGEEPGLPECTLFKVMCAALVLAMNDWPKAMLEAGYLYRCSASIEEEKLAEYIGDMEATRRHISTLIYQEKQSEGCAADYMNYGRIHTEREEGCAERNAGAGHAAGEEGIIPFRQEGFPFAARDNVQELSDFRMKNIHAIQRLEALALHPERRWEGREDADFSADEPSEEYLTEKGCEELAEKKRACAEAVFKECMPGPGIAGMFGKSRKLLRCLERRLLGRMTENGFCILAREGFAGLAVIGAAYGILTVSRSTLHGKASMAWLAAALYLVLAAGCATWFLAGERRRALRRLNLSLKRAEEGMEKADEVYARVRERAREHREYSLMERQQRRFAQAEKRRKDLLSEYEQMLLQSEGNIQQLLWIFGREPAGAGDIQSRAAVDFSVPPKEHICCYMPHYRESYELVMAGAGIVIQVPFSFFGDFEIKKVFLPYLAEDSEGEEPRGGDGSEG